MTYIIERDNTLNAWRDGCTLLLESQGQLTNLVTTITAPCHEEEDWLTAHSASRLLAHADDARDVANTLFPQNLYHRYPDREEFYARYLSVHDRAHRWSRGRHAWGTYFERLLRFPPNGVNQLERAIEKLNSWPIRNMTGLVFHLSSPAIDAPRTRGGPCWQFAEILWKPQDVLDLVVVYRNHDFFNKALGNFVGLGRLLRFICEASNKTPGQLICHSVHVYSDSSQNNLRLLAQ